MESILNTLLSWYTFDLWVFTQWWVYAFILPIVFYLPFFLLKWAIVTAPIWLPLRLMLNGIVSIKKNH